MPFTQKTTLIRLRYRDNDGAESTCQVNYAPSVSIDTLLSLASTWRAIIGALSSAQCIEADIVVQFAEIGAITAGAQSNTRRSGLFTYNTAASLFSTFRVPSIIMDAICIDGSFPGIEIDLLYGDVSIFNSYYVNGIDGVHACDIDGSDIIDVSSAFVEQF